MAFSITILGSSAAIPTSSRNPSAIVVNMDYSYFLMDCGEGTQIQLRRSKLKMQKIHHIFISHLHGDHYFGLVGLISTLNLLGRKDELNVYGPHDLEKIIQIQLEASQSNLGYPIVFHITNPNEAEIIYETDEHYVKSFPLDHSIETTGFLFSEKQKPRRIKKAFLYYDFDVPVEDILKIKAGADFVTDAGKLYKNIDITENPPQALSFAYCSDTKFYEPVVEYIKNANVLYHEATFMEDMRNVADEKFHSTALGAALIAKKAQVGRLILGHFSARYKNLDNLLEEAKSTFPDTELAADGVTIKLDANEKTRL
ncbi:MAG: ribonuclease Z [Bacteroidales bacterium]|nr:ribonuclease Z [Bacteroidales bacterium]